MSQALKSDAIPSRAALLSGDGKYDAIANSYLSMPTKGSIWRSSRPGAMPLPRQGWKVHVSASISNASTVLAAVAEILEREGIMFKAAGSMAEIKRLNCGLFYGYSQVGKIITVYPADESAVVRIANLLADATAGQLAPAVPFERRVRSGSPVFARYGVFAADADRLIAPDGNTQPDRRDRDPAWVVPPAGLFCEPAEPTPGLLSTTYRAWRPLLQRGRGGVYRALDLSRVPARHCLLKEGRGCGEVDVDGSDGRLRLIREIDALENLQAAGVQVPELYAAFQECGNQYAVMEWLEGEDLAAAIGPDREGITSAQAITVASSAASCLSAIHRAGWVWRDLKAANFIAQPRFGLRPIDFEGAARSGAPIGAPWGSPGHTPPEWLTSRCAAPAQDCYALGIMIFQLAAQRLPEVQDGRLAPDEVKVLPERLRAIVRELTAYDEHARMTAHEASALLSQQ